MGRAVTVTRTEHTAMSLRSLAAKSDNTAQARRLLALAMVLDGASRADAARQAGMDRQTLRDRVHRYSQEGVEGLVSRTPPGAAGKLTQEQRAALRQWVIDGPDPRSAVTRSHAQRALVREHGEDGEHRTFPAVSTVAPCSLVGDWAGAFHW